MGLTAEEKEQVEVKQDVNYIYVKFKSTGKIRRFIIGGVTPRFISAEIRKELLSK